MVSQRMDEDQQAQSPARRDRQQNNPRPTKYFDPANVGRKTGYRPRDDVLRDEDGFEDVDDFFKSPYHEPEGSEYQGERGDDDNGDGPEKEYEGDEFEEDEPAPTPSGRWAAERSPDIYPPPRSGAPTPIVSAKRSAPASTTRRQSSAVTHSGGSRPGRRSVSPGAAQHSIRPASAHRLPVRSNSSNAVASPRSPAVWNVAPTRPTPLRNSSTSWDGQPHEDERALRPISRMMNGRGRQSISGVDWRKPGVRLISPERDERRGYEDGRRGTPAGGMVGRRGDDNGGEFEEEMERQQAVMSQQANFVLPPNYVMLPRELVEPLLNARMQAGVAAPAARVQNQQPALARRMTTESASCLSNFEDAEEDADAVHGTGFRRESVRLPGRSDRIARRASSAYARREHGVDRGGSIFEDAEEDEEDNSGMGNRQKPMRLPMRSEANSRRSSFVGAARTQKDLLPSLQPLDIKRIVLRKKAEAEDNIMAPNRGSASIDRADDPHYDYSEEAASLNEKRCGRRPPKPKAVKNTAAANEEARIGEAPAREKRGRGQFAMHQGTHGPEGDSAAPSPPRATGKPDEAIVCIPSEEGSMQGKKGRGRPKEGKAAHNDDNNLSPPLACAPLGDVPADIHGEREPAQGKKCRGRPKKTNATEKIIDDKVKALSPPPALVTLNDAPAETHSDEEQKKRRGRPKRIKEKAGNEDMMALSPPSAPGVLDGTHVESHSEEEPLQDVKKAPAVINEALVPSHGEDVPAKEQRGKTRLRKRKESDLPAASSFYEPSHAPEVLAAFVDGVVETEHPNAAEEEGTVWLDAGESWPIQKQLEQPPKEKRRKAHHRKEKELEKASAPPVMSRNGRAPKAPAFPPAEENDATDHEEEGTVWLHAEKEAPASEEIDEEPCKDKKGKGRPRKTKALDTAEESSAAATAAKALVRVPKEAPVLSNSVKRPSAGDDEVADNGRPKRIRHKPMEYWRGERVEYARRMSLGKGLITEGVKKIITVAKEENVVVKYRPRTVTAKRRVKTEREIVCPYENMNPTLEDPKLGKSFYTFQRLFHESDDNTAENEFSASGVLLMHKGGEKPNKSSGATAIYFFVLSGRVKVAINTSCFEVGPKAHFMIPRGM
ncbi:hypothetical protein HK101_004298 [Irineochytrium annulatum]|nr:hypothetical protein HK101_004298 [Irineochytrium annulatum]